ncbi:MAG: MFS transporter [Acidimicrobiales bacterium]
MPTSNTPSTYPRAWSGGDDSPVLSGLAIAVLLLGFSLSVTDFFIVNVALPTIGRNLHTSDSILELVVAAYGITYAVLLVLGGRLGDVIGRRRLFMGGMTAFTVTSLACAIAPSIGVLLIGRALQGASAAMMVPQVLASIQARTTGEQRAKAVGMYGATAGLSMVIGQVLGGTITWLNVAGTGWRGIFMVNVPIGIAGLVIARHAMPDSKSDLPPRIDVRGTLMLALTLLAVLVPLTEGKSLGWPVWSWVVLAGAIPLGAEFVRFERSLERKGHQPLVPPSLVAHPSMRRGLGLAIPFFASFGGFMFLYAVVSQTYLGLSALTAGATLVPLAGSFCIASLTTTRLVASFGSRVIQFGGAVQALGYGGLMVLVASEWPHPSVWQAVPVLLVAGFGQGLVVSPLFRTILADVPADRAGAGAGVLTTGQQTALALGVAVIGSVFSGLISPLGVRGSVVTVLALVVAVALIVSMSARRLPSLAEVPVAMSEEEQVEMEDAMDELVGA